MNYSAVYLYTGLFRRPLVASCVQQVVRLHTGCTHGMVSLPLSHGAGNLGLLVAVTNRIGGLVVIVGWGCGGRAAFNGKLGTIH